MIRPQPTSISLSTTDVDFHLQDIDIYHGLLGQGFKKKDVLRYFQDQRTADREHLDKINQATNKTPSTVDLIISNIKSKDCNHGRNQQSSNSVVNSKISKLTLRKNQRQTDQKPLVVEHQVDIEVQKEISSTLLPISLHAIPKTPETHDLVNVRPRESSTVQHVPRQSSLLRFAKTISSDESISPDSISQLDFDRESCRSRNSLCFHEQPELDSEQCSLIENLEELAMDDSLVPDHSTTFDDGDTATSPKANTENNTQLSSPLNPPSMQRGISSELSLPSVTRTEVQVSTHLMTQTVSPSSLSHIINRLPSSPPITYRPRSSAVSSFNTSPDLPPILRTPTLVGSTTQAVTEPRRRQHQTFDGNAYSVYNDSLPASSQPQTPAELSRYTPISEHNAAYTAPPGMFGRLARPGPPQVGEPPEQSPTRRAMDIRQRRNREFARSARVEGLRMLRSRRRERRDADTDQIQGLVAHDGQLIQEADMWRDDLDADRVGEENFEDEEGFMGLIRDGIRAFSGNRHRHGV